MLLNLHYAKFGVSNFLFSKVTEEKPLRVGSIPPPGKGRVMNTYLMFVIPQCLSVVGLIDLSELTTLKNVFFSKILKYLVLIFIKLHHSPAKT